jgi:hypothetical protein
MIMTQLNHYGLIIHEKVILLQAQLVVLAAQISWSEQIDAALQAVEKAGGSDLGPVSGVLDVVMSTLDVLANSVVHEEAQIGTLSKHISPVLFISEYSKMAHFVSTCKNIM